MFQTMPRWRLFVEAALLPAVGGLLLAALAGCGSATRTITITTKPPDAQIDVNGVPRGRGRVVQQFQFRSQGQSHRVTASRPGYGPDEFRVTLDDPPTSSLELALSPLSKTVRINVSPAAYISINDRPLAEDMVSGIDAVLGFGVDNENRFPIYTIRATRPNYQDAVQTVTANDPQRRYDLELKPLRKPLKITTNPPGAQIYIDNEDYGKASPFVTVEAGLEFPEDEKGELIERVVEARLPGYEPTRQSIGWDDGKTDYVIDLAVRSKPVRIITDPPGSTVTIDGKELKRNPAGESVARLQFPPDEQGDPRTWRATVTRRDKDAIWQPQELVIGWDGGREPYTVKLKEVLEREVPLVQWEPVRDEQGWKLIADRTTTVATKDTGDPAAPRATRLIAAPPGQSIGSLAVSPDGTLLAYTLLTGGQGGELKGQLRLVAADGVPGPEIEPDPQAADLTPTFTPDGASIVFASNRGGGPFVLWTVAASGGAPRRVEGGDSVDVWPSVDSDPNPRVFFQSFLNTKSQSRLFQGRLAGGERRDLGQPGALQPRVSPKADSVIFTRADPKTGKRDIFQVPDAGGNARNLTSTPDVDEFDAVWSPDGGAIAYASDGGGAAGDDEAVDFNVRILDMKNPRDIPVTTNESRDDSPGWDPAGDAIYFRSNRGGQWGIWRIEVQERRP